MTKDEFEALLEEAFLAGYNDAIDEIFEEDNTFDLEDEMDSYNEENKAPLALDPNLFKNGKATTVIDKYNKSHKIFKDIVKNKIKEKIKKGDVMNISDLDKLLDKYGEKHESFLI